MSEISYNINSLHAYSFSDNRLEHNHIIRGVSGQIQNRNELSRRLGINVARIRGFRISGSDIYFNIKGTYTLGKNAFMDMTTIIEYNDLTGLCTRLAPNCFRNSSVEIVRLPQCTIAEGTSESDSGAARFCRKLRIWDAPLITEYGIAMFQQCALLEYLDVTKLQRVYGGGSRTMTYGFISTSSITFTSFDSLVSFNNYQTFCKTGNEIWDFPVLEAIYAGRHDAFVDNTKATQYNFPVLKIAYLGQGFQGNTLLQELEFPEVTEFYGSVSTGDTGAAGTGILRNSGVKSFKLPKCTVFEVSSPFVLARNLELVEAKKCHKFGQTVDGTRESYFFTEAGLSTTNPLNVHIGSGNLTCNNGGLHHEIAEILAGGGQQSKEYNFYFYDDDGTLVETLTKPQGV